MKKKDLYRLEQKKTRQEIADFLKKVAGEVEAGKLTLSEGSMKTELDLPQELTLDIDVDQDMEKEGLETSVEFELKWYK